MLKEDKEKDICQHCEHYWLDFPLLLEEYVPHCEILDDKPGCHDMNDEISYPCLKCPFDSYIKKK